MIVHYRSLLARWFLPRRYVAITLASHVLTRESGLDESILRHEQVHVEQWRRHGLFGFLVRYLWCHFKYGYAGNPFEIEARQAERNSRGTSSEKESAGIDRVPGFDVGSTSSSNKILD